MKVREFLFGIVGTALSSTGAISNINEVLSIISYIFTILGGIITLIVIPLLTWWRKSKEDGKITQEEIQEGVDIIKHGVEQLEDKKDKDEK